MKLTKDQSTLTELNEGQTRVLVELSSMKGLSNKQLTELLGMKKTNVSTSTSRLEDLKLIYSGKVRYTEEDKRHSEKPFYISFRHPAKSRKELRLFELIIEKLHEMNEGELISKLLNSESTNKLIEKYGFLSFYNILKGYIDLYPNAYQSILDLPAFKKGFKIYPDVIKERAEFYKSPRIAFYFHENNLIDLLRTFNPIDAIGFYRENINETYNKLLRGPEANYFSEGLKEFIDLDIYLSPFTSYPVNNPIRLLFARPFERLYNDVYLLDESDYKKFIKRIYILYSHFGEIIAQGIRYLIWERDSYVDYEIHDLGKRSDITDPEFWAERHDAADYFSNESISFDGIDEIMDNILKTSIIYWNRERNRINFLTSTLDYRHKGNGSGKYHIFTHNRGLNIVDLETNKQLPNSSNSKELPGTYFLVDIISDYFADLSTDFRPCNAFERLGLEVETRKFEDLLEDLRSNLFMEAK